jgi:hypothetical protein
VTIVKPTATAAQLAVSDHNPTLQEKFDFIRSSMKAIDTLISKLEYMVKRNINNPNLRPSSILENVTNAIWRPPVNTNVLMSRE